MTETLPAVVERILKSAPARFTLILLCFIVIGVLHLQVLAKLDAISARVAEHDTRITSIAQWQDGITSRLSELRSDITGLSQRIDRLIDQMSRPRPRE